MRAVVQRVSGASVTIMAVDKKISREISRGVVALVGVAKGDTDFDAKWLAEKIVNMRIFPNEEDKFDKSLIDIKGDCLAISQFTVFGNCGKGRRPDFTSAADAEEARALYRKFVKYLGDSGVKVETGEFAANMLVDIKNDGPVTIILDSMGFKAY